MGAHSTQVGYIPFLGGARKCPAQQMVLTQYALIVVLFVQKFEAIENRDPESAFVNKSHSASKAGTVSWLPSDLRVWKYRTASQDEETRQNNPVGDAGCV